jgi:hypothetical protein
MPFCIVIAEVFQIFRDSGDLMRFHGEQHDVLRSGILHVLHGAHVRRARLFAILADDGDAVRADGVEVRAARDHRDVFTCCRQPSAEIASDRSRSDDGDFHESSLSRVPVMERRAGSALLRGAA